MAQDQAGSGCLWLAAIAGGLLMVGYCSGGAGRDGSSAGSEGRDYRYVTADSLNCRVGPTTEAAIEATLGYGDFIIVVEESDGWLRLDRLTPCWVSLDYVSDTRPPFRLRETAPEPARQPVYRPPPRSPAPARNSGYSCARRPYCTQISTCDEAYFYMNQCGLSRLDGDNDGVPCERVCG